MKQLVVVIILFLAFSSQAETGEVWHKNLSFGLTRRVQKLDWNIAGSNVNILSELTWSNVVSVGPYAQFHLLSPGLWFFNAYLAISNIVSGDNQDSDYLSNNRQDEFSRSNNSANSGYNTDVDLSYGHAFPFRINTHLFTISPQIGYGYHAQNLTMTNGKQTISVPPNQTTPLGPFSGLNSSYDATWNSIWLGFDFDTLLVGHLSIMAAYQYHIATYDAKANWNLRSDFQHPVSFEHTGNGSGWVAKLGLSYQLYTNWAITLTDIYQKWQITNGTDTTFFSDGSIGATKLNEVNWQSNAIQLGARYSF